MTSRPRVQRLAEYLLRRACRRLPEPARDECYREWTAELPAILQAPDTRLALHRSVRALLFAADQGRGTRRLSAKADSARGRTFRTRVFRFVLRHAEAVAVGFAVWLVATTLHPSTARIFGLVALAAIVRFAWMSRRLWLKRRR
jgi:hypothetical protein